MALFLQLICYLLYLKLLLPLAFTSYHVLILEYAGQNKVPKFKLLKSCSLLIKCLPGGENFHPNLTIFFQSKVVRHPFLHPAALRRSLGVYNFQNF